MAKYIDADKLIELATHEGAYGYVDIHDILKAPAADVEEVIRCRNCRYWLEGHYCMYDDQVHTHSDFCSWAERIEKPDENAGN